MRLQPEDLDAVRARCITDRITPDARSVTGVLRELKPGITQIELLQLTEEVLAEFHGLGPLEEVMSLPGLTDVLVNRFDEIWIDRGFGMERTSIKWNSEIELRNFASRLAGLSNHRLDENHPFVDLLLPSGARFHALIPPLATSGTKVSIRIPKSETRSMQDLIAKEMFDESCAKILQRIIEKKISFVISGGTGTGKTTLLAALLGLISPDQRIVIVEDSSELAISHPHVVSLQSRIANVEGIGEVTMQTLVRQSLRMRPDRLIVGEVRGHEVVDFLNALNTGHMGSATTIHANSAESVPTRIEALGLMAGLPREAIHAQLLNAIQVVIELRRELNGPRKLSKISVLTNVNGFVTAVPAFVSEQDEQRGPGSAVLMELIA